AYQALLHDSVEKAVDVFSKRGAFVAFTTVPCFGLKFQRFAMRGVAIDAELRQIAAHDPRLHLIDWNPFLCPGGPYVASKDGVVLRPDGIHFKYPGTRIVWQWLGPRVMQLARDAQAARQHGVRASVPTTTG